MPVLTVAAALLAFLPFSHFITKINTYCIQVNYFNMYIYCFKHLITEKRTWNQEETTKVKALTHMQFRETFIIVYILDIFFIALPISIHFLRRFCSR